MPLLDHKEVEGEVAEEIHRLTNFLDTKHDEDHYRLVPEGLEESRVSIGLITGQSLDDVYIDRVVGRFLEVTIQDSHVSWINIDAVMMIAYHEETIDE